MFSYSVSWAPASQRFQVQKTTVTTRDESMKTHELIALGIPKGPAIELVHEAIKQWGKASGGRVKKSLLIADIVKLAECPEDYLEDTYWAEASRHRARSRRIRSTTCGTSPFQKTNVF